MPVSRFNYLPPCRVHALDLIAQTSTVCEISSSHLWFCPQCCLSIHLSSVLMFSIELWENGFVWPWPSPLCKGKSRNKASTVEKYKWRGWHISHLAGQPGYSAQALWIFILQPLFALSVCEALGRAQLQLQGRKTSQSRPSLQDGGCQTLKPLILRQLISSQIKGIMQA